MVVALEGSPGNVTGGMVPNDIHVKHKIFSEYYQIGRGDQSSKKRKRRRFEPEEEEELKNEVEGSHSLFGLNWQIITATGWSLRRVMWGINYPCLILMNLDTPGVKSKKNKKDGALALFQTKLK